MNSEAVLVVLTLVSRTGRQALFSLVCYFWSGICYVYCGIFRVIIPQACIYWLSSTCKVAVCHGSHPQSVEEFVHPLYLANITVLFHLQSGNRMSRTKVNFKMMDYELLCQSNFQSVICSYFFFTFLDGRCYGNDDFKYPSSSASLWVAITKLAGCIAHIGRKNNWQLLYSVRFFHSLFRYCALDPKVDSAHHLWKLCLD